MIQVWFGKFLITRQILNFRLGAMVAARFRDYYDRQARERMQVRKGDQPGASVENFPHMDNSKARDAAGLESRRQNLRCSHARVGRTLDASMTGGDRGLSLSTADSNSSWGTLATRRAVFRWRSLRPASVAAWVLVNFRTVPS